MSDSASQIKGPAEGPGHNRPPGEPKKTWVDKLPPWFAVLFGVVYGTGFLIAFSFADYIGVRGAVVEGLRAKYVHVGILCLQFPLSVGVILFGTILMLTKSRPVAEGTEKKNDESKEPSEAPRLRWERRKRLEALAMPAFSIVLLLFFYLLTTFARPGHFSSHERSIALFFLSVVLGALLMAWQRGLFLRQNRFKTKVLDRWSVEIRWIFVAVLFVQTAIVFRSLTALLWEMFKFGGYMYFLLIFLIGEFAWRLKGRFDSDNGAGLVRPYMAMGVSLCGALFYLSTLVFAVRVYSYIPVAKGGGDYVDETLCIMRFDEASEKSIPADIIDSTKKPILQSNPVVVIDETDNTLFVAMTDKTNNPNEWRKPGVANKPKIIRIRRDVVTSIERVK